MLSQLVPWPGRDGTLLPPLSCGRAEPRHRAAGWDGRGRRAQEGPGEKPQGGLGRGSRALTLGGALPVSGEHGGLGSEGPAGSGQSAEDGGPGGLHAAAGCCVLLSGGAL